MEISGVLCKVENRQWKSTNKAFGRHLMVLEKYLQTIDSFDTYPSQDERSAQRMLKYFEDLGIKARIISWDLKQETVTNRIY